MINPTPMRRDATYTLARPPAFEPYVRPARDEEVPWIVKSWSEHYKNSPAMRRKTWPDYKALDVPVLRGALERSDTTVLCCEASVPGRAVGWLAFARWPSIDAVHWVYVTAQYRRARSRGLAPVGVMTALLAAAALRDRVVYTHLASTREGQRRAPVRNDMLVADLLRAQGKVVSYIPYQEWSK